MSPMRATEVAQTIQLIIAPVVLVTACAIIQGGILGRFVYVGQRMRSLTHERLELLHSNKMDDSYAMERVQEIDRQIPLLIRRHRLLQNSVLLVYSAIAIFLVSMFAIALSVGFNSGGVARAALTCFLIGTGVLLTAVLLAGQEVRMSHQAICYEANRVRSLKPF